MQQKIEKGTEEFTLFMDFWKLHQDFYEPRTEDEWYQVVNGSDVMFKKYKGTKLEHFAKELIMAHMNECERKYKNARK